MGLGLGIGSMMSGSASAAVVIEDYLWSGTYTTGEGGICELQPRFANVTSANVQDYNDAWDNGTTSDSITTQATVNEMMPAVDLNPSYLSDDEGYWVIIPLGEVSYHPLEDMTKGQDGTDRTELTPIACSNFPIGDGTYV